MLNVSRRIYDGDVDAVKTKGSLRKLPIEAAFMSRMRKLGDGDWVFRSRGGTPLNPGHALRRHIRPAATELGIPLGGWHDFRHTLTTNMRRNEVHLRVISGILGHAKVTLAMDTLRSRKSGRLPATVGCCGGTGSLGLRGAGRQARRGRSAPRQARPPRCRCWRRRCGARRSERRSPCQARRAPGACR